MAELINTIIEPADEGSFVSKAEKNPYRLPVDYAPRDYQRAAKKVIYCYDDGSIKLKGIGDYSADNAVLFRPNSEIVVYHHRIYLDDAISEFNWELAEVYDEEIINEIEKDEWIMHKSELDPYFLKIMDYLKKRDVHTPPEPFRSYGFLYYKEKSEGEICYYVRAITGKEDHKEVNWI